MNCVNGMAEPYETAHLLADLEDAIGAVGDFDQLANGFRRDPGGLLAIHVLARVERRDRHFDVQVTRSFNEYSLDVVAGEQLAIILQSRGLVPRGDGGAFVQAIW